MAQLERDGSLSGWYDREISAGADLDAEISAELNQAELFLACVSPDYIASTYCYDRELETALEREAAGRLIIVPVIFEPCEWLQTPLNKFKAVPQDGKPVSEFTNPNVALLDVVSELRRLTTKMPLETKSLPGAIPPAVENRYRVKREHDAVDKKEFIDAAYKEILQFFQISTEEINAIQDIRSEVINHDPTHFSCTVINRGFRRGVETIHITKGGSWGVFDIQYGDKYQSNTSHGGFTLGQDDYDLYLKPGVFGFSSENKLMTAKDAAQHLWDELISRVGIDYA